MIYQISAQGHYWLMYLNVLVKEVTGKGAEDVAPRLSCTFMERLLVPLQGRGEGSKDSTCQEEIDREKD